MPSMRVWPHPSVGIAGGVWDLSWGRESRAPGQSRFFAPGQGQLLKASGAADPLWLPLASFSNRSAAGRRRLVGKGLTRALEEKGLAAFVACQTLFSRG